MRFHSWIDLAGVTLGALAEGIWCGALAAALTGASGAVMTAFAAATVAAAAAIARRFSKGEVQVRGARLLAAALILVATGALLAGGHAWARPSPIWLATRDIVYAGGLVVLGIHLGRARQSPEVAAGRSLRSFALLCVILVLAAVSGSAPGWASGAIVASLVVGGLLVATVRYRDLTDLVDPAERLPAWPWLLAVTGAVLLVIALGALLSQVLRVDVLLAALGAFAGLLHSVLDGVAYVIGYAGAALVRALGWLLGLFHVHALQSVQQPTPAATPSPLLQRRPPDLKAWNVSRLITTAVGALLAMVLSLTLVVLALRRFRRGPSAEVLIVEEREAITSLRSAAGAFAARLGRRLRRRLASRRREPGTPAESVRFHYAELERRLSRAGEPRLPGITVRDYLAAAAAAAAKAAASAEGAPPPASLAAELALIYEAARYSAHIVDADQARRFGALTKDFRA
jgi:hypothetical protein